MTRRETATVWVMALGLALLSTLPLLFTWDHWGNQDWDHHFALHEVARRTIVENGQLPLWNPFALGGMPLLGYPQSRVLTPFVLLHLLFGVVIGLKLEIILHLAILLAGTYVWARRWLTPTGATITAVSYGLSSMFVWSLVVGMTWFMAVAYVPWLLVLITPTADRPSARIGAAMLLTLMFFEGGSYVVVITGLALSWLVLTRRPWRPRFTPLRHWLEILALAGGLGAIKIFPAIMMMRRYPRPTTEYSGFSVGSLLSGLLDRGVQLLPPSDPAAEPGFWLGTSYGADENASYVGLVVVVLMVVGVLFWGRRHWRWALCGLLFLWVGFGNRITPSLWLALHSLPVFSSMRVAQRFRIIFLLVGALLAGLGLEGGLAWLRQRARSRWVAASGWILVLAVTVDILLVSMVVWDGAFPVLPIPVGREPTFSRVAGLPTFVPLDRESVYREQGSWRGTFPAVQANLGTTLDDLDYPGLTPAAIPRTAAHYRGETFLRRGSGPADIRYWSPNRMVIDLAPAKDDVLIVNQNYDPGWRVEGGIVPVSVHGLLAVPVQRDTQTIELQYCPPEFTIGWIVTVLTLLVALGRWWWWRSGGRRSSRESSRG